MKTSLASPQKIREIVERLEKIYGKATLERDFEPIDELISCILSQNTSDTNSFPAFYRLKETYPHWELALEAGPEAVAEIIRRAGLANQKARSIIGCLQAIKNQRGNFDLNFLKQMPLLEARQWLMSLPGVGPKTASIVLSFSLHMPAIPVDTHVYRVAKRLGLIPEKADANKAHDILLEIVPVEIAFDFHVALIRHGRQICKAPRPQCPLCPLKDLCSWYQKHQKEFEKISPL